MLLMPNAKSVVASTEKLAVLCLIILLLLSDTFFDPTGLELLATCLDITNEAPKNTTCNSIKFICVFQISIFSNK